MLLDQRVRPMGSHHQKFVVVRHPDRPERDVAFVGGIDLGHGRRDDADHLGDPQTQPFADGLRRQSRLARRAGRAARTGGPRRRAGLPRALGGPGRPEPAALARRCPTWSRHVDRTPSALPDAAARAAAGRRVHRAAAADLPEPAPRLPVRPGRRAQRGPRLRQGAAPRPPAGLRRGPVPVVAPTWRRCSPPRCAASPGCGCSPWCRGCPTRTGACPCRRCCSGTRPALQAVKAAGGDRVQVYDVENRRAEPVYVHAKVCVVDDVWAAVGQRQRQPPLVDPRQRADRRRGRRPAGPAAPGRPRRPR